MLAMIPNHGQFVIILIFELIKRITQNFEQLISPLVVIVVPIETTIFPYVNNIHHNKTRTVPIHLNHRLNDSNNSKGKAQF